MPITKCYKKVLSCLYYLSLFVYFLFNLFIFYFCHLCVILLIWFNDITLVYTEMSRRAPRQDKTK